MARRLAAEGVYRGPGQVCGRLHRISWYPAAVPLAEGEESGDRILGDIFALPADEGKLLAALDAFEDYRPSEPTRGEYRREIVSVQRAGDAPVNAWIYWYQWPVPPSSLIPGGDWRKWYTNPENASLPRARSPWENS